MRHQFKRFALITIAVGGLAALSGCTSMTPEECAAADWRQIGYADASRGNDQSRIDDHRRACAEAGVTPDLNAYLAGFDKGLPNYCTRETGFNQGSRGNAAPSQCNNKRFYDFVDGYDNGRRYYAIDQKRLAVEEDLKKTDQIINDLAAHITDLTTQIDSGTLPDDERREKERQRDSFRTLLAETELDRRDIVLNRDRLQSQLDAFRY